MSKQMVVAADNILLSVLVAAACLCLIFMGRAEGQRVKLILGGVGLAAAMVAAALIGDAILGGGSP
ncbi:MAG: hypothetical protein IT566_10500 [Rhodospirillaceae bacterium]|nr:hypothetical protein [Rhodospirillaceae bacterium]